MTRIALLSLYDENFRDIGEITSRNKFEYCARYNYSFHLVTHGLQAPPTHYSKVPFIQTVLPLHDWVVWLDADALIMNFTIPIETYLDERYSMVIGSDWVGINSGVFFLRRCPWSFEFLRQIPTVSKEGLGFFEQSQMEKILAKDRCADDHVKIIPLKQIGGEGDFNCYPTENPNMPRDEKYQYFDHGDFIAHFVGTQYSGDEHKQFLTRLIKGYAQEVIV